jgi:1-acyl-sn-glycerol-3-phosphate acyltransferase
MKSLWNYCKLIWLGFWLLTVTIVLFMPIVMAAVLSKTGGLAFNLTKLWAWIILTVTRTRISVTGRHNIKEGQSYIIIANHQSHFDILALVCGLGVQYRWVIKQEIRKIPLFGYALHASRNIFIDRSDHQSAIRSINEGMDRLPDGAGVLFFAEGTRSPDGQIHQFKKGGFTIALERQLPILPVTVNGSRKLLPKNSMVFSSGTIEVAISAPIDTSGYTTETIAQLIEKTRNAVVEKFNPDYPAGSNTGAAH